MGLAAANLNGNQRNELVRDICTLISTHTRYPTEAERQIIAQKVVAKYPFLKDPKIGCTSTEWVRLSVQINMVLYNIFIQYCKMSINILIGGNIVCLKNVGILKQS
jgi:hypothetical protein